MILKAKHNWFIYNFFKGYTLWRVRRQFKPVKLLGEFHDKQMPVLLLSNHISWWDGFWALYINLKILKRKFHFMMLEDQLRKYWFFKYAGGFSVNKKSRSSLETLEYAADLLTDPKNMVLLFPQGEIESIYSRNFRFEKGLERIIKAKENNIQCLFLAFFIDYFSNPKPGIYCYLEEYDNPGFNATTIQNHYIEFYNRCLDKQVKLKDIQ